MKKKAPCAFCGKEANLEEGAIIAGEIFNNHFYDCPQCGHYVLGEYFGRRWEGSDSEEAFKIACLVQEKQLAKKDVYYGVLDDRLPISQQNFPRQLKWLIGH